MSAKSFLLDFINYLCIILLILFCIFFFIDPTRFARFINLMQALIPLAIFGIIFLIKIKFGRRELERKREENSLDIVLYLNYFDKLKSDLIVFGLPLILLAVALLFSPSVGLAHVLEALAAFLVAFFWQRNLFKKCR